MVENSALMIVPPPPPKFTLQEWHLNNRARYRDSEAQQELAEGVLEECKRVCETANEIARANKNETDHRLAERAEDVAFRRTELQRVRKEIILEVDALSVYKERILSALNDLRKNALHVCEQCLIVRERRLGIDLVRDNVERELRKECEVIKGVDNLLMRVLEQTQEQIRRLKATLYNLDRSLENKESSINIDRHNLSLKETSLNLSMYHGTRPLDYSSLSIEEWDRKCNEIITGINKELNSARPLRCYIDSIINQTIDDLNNQKAATNEAFRKRIEETKEVKTKLELQHSEIMRQANVMMQEITRIKKCIAEKEGYMALAHTRLGNRCQRPDPELTHDLPGTYLTKEVYDLREAVKNLQHMLYEAEASLRYLLKTQIQIEEDINIKINTLKIDEVDCMTMRQSVEYHAY